MTKLHELLAVETDRETAATAILAETANTFSKKPEHFIGKHSVYQPFDENDSNEKEETTKELVETAYSKLSHCFGIVAKAVDVTASKDATNQNAVADLVVNGETLAQSVPATTLLMLENRIKKWMEVLLQIPTLAPGRKWELSPERGPNIFIDANPEARYRTKKVIQHKVLVDATEHHPAQVEKWSEDVRIGKVTDTTWCGMMSPAEKSQVISRAQELLAAVKQARQRANSTEVTQVSIAKKLTNFILG
jgi:hypothetical protein